MVPLSGTPPAEPAAPAPRFPVLRLSTWSIVRAVVAVALGLVALRIVQAAETPLWWIAISAVIAALLTPLALCLSRVMPSALAITVVLVGFLAAGGFTLYRGLAEISTQVSELRADAEAVARDVESSEQYGDVATEFGLSAKVSDFFDGLPAYIGGGDTVRAVQAATSNAGSLVAIGFLLLLLMISGRRFVTAGVAQVFEPPARQEFEAVLGRAYRRLSRHLGVVFARALATGIAVYVVAAAVGLKAPTVVALWFALWSTVPGLGYVMAGVPLAIAASVSSWPVAVGLLAGLVVFQVLEIRFVQKPLERATLRIGPALTLLALIFGIQLYGFGGVLVVIYVLGLAVALGRELRGGDARLDVHTQLRRLLDDHNDLDDQNDLGDGDERGRPAGPGDTLRA